MPLGTCPDCGLRADLVVFLDAAEVNRGYAAALEMPAPLAARVARYLRLFAPPKKSLAWTKLNRLATELVAMVTSGEVTRHRDTRPASPQAWAEGFDEVLAMREAGTLTLPLDGHGLLCEIVYRRAARAQTQQQAAARPLHPSHRPAEGREEWEHARARGAQHVSRLLGAIRPAEEPPGARPGEAENEAP